MKRLLSLSSSMMLALPVAAQNYPAKTVRIIVPYPAGGNADIARILDTPKMREWLAHDLGGEFAPNTPDQFNALLATDTARWMKIINETGVKVD